jgi:hypothetical protein
VSKAGLVIVRLARFDHVAGDQGRWRRTTGPAVLQPRRRRSPHAAAVDGPHSQQSFFFPGGIALDPVTLTFWMEHSI